MTENRNNGGLAFPQHDLSGYGIGPAMDGDRYLVGGMALRDWFAGQATMGICAHADTWGLDDAGIVKKAYEMADLLLATRSSSKEA